MKKIIIALAVLASLGMAACTHNTDTQLTPEQQQLYKGGN
jgi:hypothetical protein